MSAYNCMPNTIYQTTLLRLSSYGTEKMNTNKHKNLKRKVGMVGPKCMQTRVVGIITDKTHPYTFFIEMLLLEYWMQGCILSCYPYYCCLHSFWPYHPYLSLQLIQLLFILVSDILAHAKIKCVKTNTLYYCNEVASLICLKII